MKFKTISIDPPWSYDIKVTGGSKKKRHSGISAACQKYNVMEYKDIVKLPIDEVADENSYLILWTTVPFLEKACRLVGAWGFEYRTAIFWEKVKYYGLGYWFRNRYEVALVGKRGNVKPFHSQDENVINTYDTCDVNEYTVGEYTLKEKPVGHSIKPTQFYKLIEPVVPKPRLEIFARELRDGWTCVGNEIDGKDVRESLRELIDKTDNTKGNRHES